MGEESFGGLDILKPGCGVWIGRVRHKEDDGNEASLEEEVSYVG